VGLAIHELPSLGLSAGRTPLAPGNVLTVEPGIYLEGWGGVRIEDLAVVTESGCRILSKSPK
jgi:Xaa-Pro aminopeptidase